MLRGVLMSGILFFLGCVPVAVPPEPPFLEVPSPLTLVTELQSNGNLRITVDVPSRVNYRVWLWIDGEKSYEVSSGETWASYTYLPEPSYVADFLKPGAVSVTHELATQSGLVRIEAMTQIDGVDYTLSREIVLP